MAGCEFDDLGGWTLSQDFYCNYPLKTGGRITLESFNGSVEISPWDQGRTSTHQRHKYARSQDESRRYQIEIDHSPTPFRFVPSSHVAVRKSRGALRDQGAAGAWCDRLITSAGGHTPPTALVRALQDVNGGIHVFSFRGELNIETSNGTRSCTMWRFCERPHVKWRRPRRRPARRLDVTTSNGGIHVGGPLRGTSARHVERRYPADAARNSARPCGRTPATAGSPCTCPAKSTRASRPAPATGPSHRISKCACAASSTSTTWKDRWATAAR